MRARILGIRSNNYREQLATTVARSGMRTPTQLAEKCMT